MISNIEINNYKSIKSVNIELKNLNILIGANGAGKSNFINFFEFLNYIYNQNLQTYTISHGGADNILCYGSKESEFLSGKVIFDNVNYYDFKLMPSTNNNFYFDYETTGFNKNFEINPAKMDWQEESLIKGKSESVLKDGSTFRHRHFVEHFNNFKVFHFHDTSDSSKLRKYCNIDDNSFLKEDGSNLPAFLYWLKEKHPDNFRLIEKLIKSVAPFFKEFDLKPMKLNPDFIKLEWKEEGVDTYFDASNFSDGTIRFICLATLLMQPEAPRTIIMDEPELGLHPFAINKLAGMINSAAKRSQIIISTQSVNLVENFSADDIIVADRSNQQSTFTRLSSENLEEWIEDYTLGELWEKNVIGGQPQ